MRSKFSKKGGLRRRIVRKRGFKKRNSYKPISTVGRALSPFPQRYITKMKYAESISTTIALSNAGIYVFNLNSVYDPNRTGTGHQPQGFDQLSAIYNRYRVIACSYRIGLVLGAVDTTNLNYGQMCVIPSNDNLALTSVADARERPRAKYVLQAPGSPVKMLTGKVYMPSLAGVSATTYKGSDRYQSIVSTSPTEALLLNVVTGFINDASVTSQSYILNVELQYTVEWFDPQALAQS